MFPSRRGPSLLHAVVSYSPDWLITGAMSGIVYYLDNHVTGFKRQFMLTDVSLQYPYNDTQRIGTQELRLLCGGLPFAVQTMMSWLHMGSWWDLHHSALGLLLSITITNIATLAIKVTAGRPSPDLISRCQPLIGPEGPPQGLTTVDICTQASKSILEDGWRSFPSSHSSLSFAGLGFLAFYLSGKLRPFDNRGHTIKLWLSFLPLGVASLIALSRMMDYRHHLEDIVFGCALGLGAAYFSYRQYYPHLASKTPHVPLKTRFEELEHAVINAITIPHHSSTTEPEHRHSNIDEEVGLISGRRHPRVDNNASGGLRGWLRSH